MSVEPAPPAPSPASGQVPPVRVRWRGVLVFLVVASGLFALAAAPFWFLTGGIAHPLYTWVISLGMLAPAVATVVAVKLVEKGQWRRSVGLRFRGLWGRIALWSLLGVVVVLGLNVATALVLVLRGVPSDPTGRTWAQIVTEQFAEAGAPMSTPVAVLVVLASSVIGLLITVVPALGEEIGWRGYLWQRLKPLGFPGAVAVGGLAWSLWHLPVVLLGHNYPGIARPWAVAMFIVACVAMNYLFGAITERAGGNPIPAAFAHATLNSTLGLVLGVVSTSETPQAMNWLIDTPLGLTGIVLMTILAALVMPRSARRTFGPHPEVSSVRTDGAPAWTSRSVPEGG